ncbi:Crp/Fnr family transcriptional regulator [Clostridium gasigenes]|uniref:Crp/Fnr family transcriptional regulator n=1 Tax=Clostridium gasigenes TaxID=94869 RepID=A0A1H0VGI3_9CLOT|nr:Crp/Fnr family transcriptional regulator [Clostridium gasigenes]MBB6714762.1 Crp/Fnr family transcriptional regulator [Clostridium gasigenes]SDP77186.1 CRP/FNR family transcriptional regulator, anaerobic regulatory protein [Clostridium gasigenes]
MNKKKEVVDNNLNNIEKLFEIYPILKEINNELIRGKTIFEKIEAGQYLSSIESECTGLLFVISGVIKIQKINEDGEETNLYNIKKGDLCHEALSCIIKCESLNIVAKALEDSKIFIMNIDITKNILLKDTAFLEYMYKDIYSKFNNVLNNKEKIIHEPLEIRLIKLLISKNSNVIYAKHSELAFDIDSTRESVSRKLKNIERMGYIKITRGKIVIIKELKELQKISNLSD